MGRHDRANCWTESIAIGDRAFVDEAEQTVPYRQSMERCEVDSLDGERAWVVREHASSYHADTTGKTGR